MIFYFFPSRKKNYTSLDRGSISRTHTPSQTARIPTQWIGLQKIHRNRWMVKQVPDSVNEDCNQSFCPLNRSPEWLPEVIIQRRKVSHTSVSQISNIIFCQQNYLTYRQTWGLSHTRNKPSFSLQDRARSHWDSHHLPSCRASGCNLNRQTSGCTRYVSIRLPTFDSGRDLVLTFWSNRVNLSAPVIKRAAKSRWAQFQWAVNWLVHLPLIS